MTTKKSEGAYIQLGDKRWAAEPVGPETLRFFERVEEVAPAKWNANTVATLWRLKKARGQQA